VELKTPYYSHFSHSVFSSITYFSYQHARTPLKFKYLFTKFDCICEVHRITKNALLHSDFESWLKIFKKFDGLQK